MPVPHAAKIAAMRLLEHAPGGYGSVSSVATPHPHVIPTFDDGPTSARTDAVLRALAEHGATATFFVLLTNVRAHRRLLDEVLAAGHEVGLHGVDHRHLPAVAPAEFAAALPRGVAELEDATGRAVRWFRPPYGDQTPATWRIVRRAGLTPVVWSGTTWDWNPDVDDDARVATAMRGLRRGTILLGHDGHAGPADLADDGPEPVLDRYRLLDRVLSACAERGLAGRSLGDALEAGGSVVLRPHLDARATARDVFGSVSRRVRAPRAAGRRGGRTAQLRDGSAGNRATHDSRPG